MLIDIFQLLYFGEELISSTPFVCKVISFLSKLYQKNSLKAILEIGKYFIIELTSMHRGVIFSHAICGINIQSSSEGSVTFHGVFYRKSHGFLCIWVHHPMEMTLLVMSGSHDFIIVLLSSFFFLQNRVFGVMFPLKFTGILPCLTESLSQRHFLSRSFESKVLCCSFVFCLQ